MVLLDKSEFSEPKVSLILNPRQRVTYLSLGRKP